MRVTELFMPTLREAPSDAEIESIRLMLRAGLIKKLASGLYSYLPAGLKVLRKIENLLRKEMDKYSAQEVQCSEIIPIEFLNETEKGNESGSEIFKIKDRNNREFYLGTEYDDIFVEVIKNEIKSYKNLPLKLYRIGNEFRDERRPRFGLIRSREFRTLNLYSFNKSDEELDKSLDIIHKFFIKFFETCGLEIMTARADLNVEDRPLSLNFMVESENGEHNYILCEACGYTANKDFAAVGNRENKSREEIRDIEKIATPDVRTIEELVSFLHTSSSKFAKTIIYKTGDRTAAVIVRGDREVNENKIKKHLNVNNIELADPDTVMKVTGAEVGFAGPVGIKADELLVDYEILNMNNLIVGANETGYHFINVNYGRDFEGRVGDFRNICEGDICPVCGASVKIKKGIKVGSISKYKTGYASESVARYKDESGGQKPVIVGCCSIGISRTISAVAERNHDEKGIIWPPDIAPYQVIVVPVAVKDEAQVKAAEEIYNKLIELGYDVLIDDRDERAGVKFNDADLIGIPVRITIGKKVKDGLVEVKLRKEQASRDVKIEDIYDEVMKIFR